MAARAIIDVDHFRHMTGNDQALQAEIVQLFRAQAELWARLLIPDAPVQTWEDSCHTLKGAARGLGLWALADACEDAEELARAGAVSGPGVSRALGRVRAKLAEALDALPEFAEASGR
ncbi:MAG: Hpt domain-containing protein [Alphaproteobacteria bacterium]|nr:Hpt domain-containing protein [Alphaproteobacteria bacterium]